jgi:Xaa-Pro aminopeptidase
MDERRLAAIIEAAYLAEGGTNHIHYFAATPMADPSICVPSQFHSTRRLQAGDILFCEISAAYWGYAGQVLRSFTIDADPTPLFTDLHRAADDAFDAIAAVTRPGTHVRDLVDASSVIEEMGFTTYDDLVHGYGGGYLPPVLGSKSRPNLPTPDMVLEEGMALVIQPNVITTDERAGVQTGHLMVVTDDGHRALHEAPRGLRRIG